MTELQMLIDGLPPRLAQWAAPLYCIQFVCVGLDPVLVAAIMDRESLGGDALKPKGPTGTGDAGHGRGLMQLDDRTFSSFASATWPNGLPVWQDSTINIYVGARHLWTYRQRASRLWPEVLDATAVALCSYNAGFGRAREAGQGGAYNGAVLIAELDKVTTGKDYVSNTLQRYEALKEAVNVASQTISRS